jgi:hypothetical protein
MSESFEEPFFILTLTLVLSYLFILSPISIAAFCVIIIIFLIVIVILVVFIVVFIVVTTTTHLCPTLCKIFATLMPLSYLYVRTTELCLKFHALTMP